MSDPKPTRARKPRSRPKPVGDRSPEAKTPKRARKAVADLSAGLPEDHLHIVPVRNMVLFPGVILPLLIGRERSIKSVDEATKKERPIGLLLQRVESTEDPSPADLYEVGTVAEVLRYLTGPEGRHQAICQGQSRFRVLEFVQLEPYPIARVELLDADVDPESLPEAQRRDLEARFHVLKQQAQEAVELWPGAPGDMGSTLSNIGSPAMLADLVATFLEVPVEERQEILERVDLRARLELVTQKLGRWVEFLRLSHKIREEAKGTLEKGQREYFLREQLHAIQKELGEGDDRAGEIHTLNERIAGAGMPEDVEIEVLKEVRRLERMPEGAAESSILRTYIELMIELPWNKVSEERIELDEAQRILDEDHYGLEKVKKRILEFLAVRKLKPEGKTASLCLVGPPGVGKTSLGQSIARAMGRSFVRTSLGGVHDEAEIRGHRRTYVGAMPGHIVTGLRKAGTRNPVFLLDEMDKLGRGLHGDPASALLEVLDPEQNGTFRDNYLGVPFDLRRVLFVGTANVLENIAPPLRDRFEVIHIPGYTEEEKLAIAERYLVPRALDDSGLTPRTCRIHREALVEIARRYTREAGVRNLQRSIAALCRHVATKVARKERRSMTIRKRDLVEILGVPRFESEIAMRTGVPGVATGLAWTPSGGEILFVEATSMKGKGRITLTGQLGEVMKESGRTAHSLVRTHAARLGIDERIFEDGDLHVHIPAGAIPKDGPSAGVAIYMALVSLLTGRCVRSDVAMTGEISLRGLVLPVGGIKSKVLGALAAGIRTVILPARNRHDLDDIPATARERLEFILVERVEEAVEAALESPKRTRGRRAGAPPEVREERAEGAPKKRERRGSIAARASERRAQAEVQHIARLGGLRVGVDGEVEADGADR